MPRGKTIGYAVRVQVGQAAGCVDRVLDHLMCADVLAKGGKITGKGKYEPVGVDILNPDKEGHPELNKWLPVMLELCASLKAALKALRKQL